MVKASKSGSKTDVTTGLGYDAGDTPVRIDGDWTENDMKQALLGHPPRGLGSPDIHHGGQGSLGVAALLWGNLIGTGYC